MDLLKSKVDNNIKSSMIFPNANWIIAYNTDIFITNEIDIFKEDIKDPLGDIKESFKNIKDPLGDIKESFKNIKDPLGDIKESFKDIKDPLGDIKESFKNIKDPLGDIKESFKNIKDPLGDIKESFKNIKESSKDIKESSKDIKEPLEDIKEPLEDIKESSKDIKESSKDIKEEIIEVNNISPLNFIKERLQLYEDLETIKNKLFVFISNQKVINKYTKRGTSLIMDGLSQDKWNINICKLFSFLLDVTFKYRKKMI